MHTRHMAAPGHAAFLLAATLAAASPAFAQWETIWSSVGSGGVVDEDKLALASLNDATAGIKASVPAGGVVYIRYPVSMRHRFYYFHPAPPGSPIPGSSVEVPYPRLTLSATFSKNEDAALVIAQLRRVRLSDGAVAGVAAVDSGGSPAAPGVQTVERTIVCPASCFDPGEFAYFVQVSLLKSSATADPRLTALRVTLGF